MEDLTGKFLIASPSVTEESYFSRSIIYIVRHDETGAMGVVVNSPLLTLDGKVSVSASEDSEEEITLDSVNTYSGGPVDVEKGFILRLKKEPGLKTEVINITSNILDLKNISKKNNKKNMLLFGYCGWDEGQLEEELQEEHWIISPADKYILFSTKDEDKWDKALEQLYIDPAKYSYHVGNC